MNEKPHGPETPLVAELEAIRAEDAEELDARRLPAPSARASRRARRLELERQLASLRGEEHADMALGPELPMKPYGEVHVVPLGPRVSVALEERDIALGAAPILVVTFEPSYGLRLEGLDYSFIEQHPLWGKGLDLAGLFVVRASRWKQQMGDVLATDPAYVPKEWPNVEHFLLRWKDGEVGCLAARVTWRRVDTTMLEWRRRLGELT